MLTFVTAFYLQPGLTYRSPTFYIERFEELLKTGVPIVCYFDEAMREAANDLLAKYDNLRIAEFVRLDTSWLPENVQLPIHRNPLKDTKEYMCIQLNKLRCLSKASSIITTSHIAWIDFGIFHILKDGEKEKAKECLQNMVNGKWSSAVVSPGSWGHGAYNYWDAICWRFSGGLLVGPKEAFGALCAEQDRIVLENLPRLTWEVNYWAMMNKFQMYYASHDLSMFANIAPNAEKRI